ncbi:unnamed protein product [Symbiodinium natans]|uniref:Ribosomal RNA large subunit methyltransferase K/L-like methyltransferase domain-containing protein n=1 Tax=Symbiodinium natans TaxID=878477 RepID=A0A812PQW5_9DINO|nr:unnamed protein product [Symbiodinium natans]
MASPFGASGSKNAHPAVQDVVQLQQLEPRETARRLGRLAKNGMGAPVLDFLASLKTRECEVNMFHYGICISSCAKNVLWQCALDLLNGMESSKVERNAVHYNACMDVYAKSAQWEMALALLGQAGSKAKPDAMLFNACITACDKGGRWQVALQILEKMQDSHVDHDLITFNSCLSALSKASEWQLAIALLASMPEETSPDTISYNVCINACEKSGFWPAALLLLGNMKSCTVPTATRTFNGCIAACGGCLEWQLALSLMAEMVERRVEYSAVTYMAATAACGRNWQYTLSLLSDMASRSMADLPTYNSCIARLSTNWQVAPLLLQSMEEQKLQANEVTFASLAAVYGKGLHWQAACRVFEDMSDREVLANNVVFGAVISACEQGSSWQSALKIWQKMSAQGMQHSTICMNSCLGALEKCQQWTLALAVLEASQTADEASHAICISACSKGRNWLVSLALLQHALQEQLPITEATLGACIKAGEEDKEWELALEIHRSVLDAGGMCAASSYFVTIGSCGRKSWQMALSLFQSARTSKLLDAFICSAAITACERHRMWDQALHLFAHMRTWHLEMNEMCCTAAMSACEKSGHWEWALHLYHLFESFAGQPGAVARCLLIDAFSAASLWEHAFSTFSTLVSMGFEADAVGCSAVLGACERRGQWRQVLALWPQLQDLQWRSHVSDGSEGFQLHSVGPVEVTACLERALENQWLHGYPLLPPGEDQLTHGLYRYVAGMQAMAARELLGLVAEGCSVLDPFCGSGTVLIESCLSGRSAIGCDLSPLAAFVAAQHADVEDMDLQAFEAAVAQVVRGTARSPNPWQQLRESIDAFGDNAVQRGLQFTFLVASQASGDEKYLQSASKLRQAQPEENGMNAAMRFRGTARLIMARLRSLRAQSRGRAEVIQTDCRDLSLTKPVQAIITSPPYPGVYNYLTTAESAAHILGSRPTDAEKSQEIGRRSRWRSQSFEEFAASWQREQEQWLQACHRLLLPGGTATLMIGDGDRDAPEDGGYNNLKSTADAAKRVGFRVIATSTIASRRTSPSDRPKGRRRTEHIIHLHRPRSR